MTGMASPRGAVRAWWPVPVLTRLYRSGAEAFGPDQGTAGFRDWLAAAAKDLLTEMCRPGETPPPLTMSIGEYALEGNGAAPRRATGAILSGVFCIAPDRNRSVRLTFLDPRAGADMVPGSSATLDPVITMALPANGLVLFPGWVAQGHGAPPADDRPRWLKLRFSPAAFAHVPMY